MGTLTKDMTRLCEEIQTLRAGRHELKKALAEKTKARQVEVLETCAAFTEARNWKAESAHTTRQNFVENLKQAVAEQGKSLRDDLATAREALSSLGSAAPSAAARGAMQVRTKIERGRKGVRHPHRP